MKKNLSVIATALILVTASLPAGAHPKYPDMIDIAGPYSFRIGTGGIGIYLAPRGEDTFGPIDRGGMPPSATQVFVANFRPGNFFTNFPSEHVAVILWGPPSLSQMVITRGGVSSLALFPAATVLRSSSSVPAPSFREAAGT